MLAPFVIFSLLATTCAQPCTNCVAPQRPYQYVVNVPMVPVQGVAVPSNSPQPCCNGAPVQQGTQMIWFSQGNGQQNSGMVSNFTAISTQGQYNYQNPTGATPPPQYVTNGNYIAPGTSPLPNQGGFTPPPPNYNPDVYLQGASTPPSFTSGQSSSTTGAPFIGNQPYSQGYPQQQGGQSFTQQPGGLGYSQQGGAGFTQQGAGYTQGAQGAGFTQQPGSPGAYNSANQQFLGNQQGYTTGPVSASGSGSAPLNNQGNYFGQDQGSYYPTGQQQYPSGQAMGQGQPGYNQQYNPQGQGGPVGNNGMVVTSYQGQTSGGAQGAGIAGGVAAGVAAGAAGASVFPYSTSSQYSTTTQIPPRTNTPGSTSPGGFQYSTQNPNQPGFIPQNEQGGFASTAYPSTSYPGSSAGSPYPTTMGTGQVAYGPSSQIPNQQGGFSPTGYPSTYTAGGSSYGPTTQTPFASQNEGLFSTRNQYNQGAAGFIPTTTTGPQPYYPSSTVGQQQHPSSSSQFGPSSTMSYGSTTPYPQQYQPSSTQGPSSTTPFTYNYQGSQGTTQGPYFGQSSTGAPMQQTGFYPPGAQQDQASTTRPPNVNVAGGGQATSTFSPVGSTSSSSGSSALLGQDSRGTFVGSPTTPRPNYYYDTSSYGPYGPTTIGGISSSQYSTTSGPLSGGGASGGAGYTPQYDFEHNMNTQYGHYNTTSSTGNRQNDAPQPTAQTSSAGGLHLVLMVALSLLFF